MTKFKDMADDLRSQIISGEFPEGSLIPSESLLIKRYQISRQTVREAVNLLVKEGYLLKKRGRWSGTMVLTRDRERNLLRSTVNFGILGSEHIFDSEINDAAAVEYGIVSEVGNWNATLSIFPFLSQKFPDALPFVKDLLPRNIVDGLFVFQTGDTKNFLEYLLMMKIPTVFLYAGEMNLVLPEQISYVYIQEQQPIDRFILNLKVKGYRQIILLGDQMDFNHHRTHDLFSVATRKARLDYYAENCSELDFVQLTERLKKYAGNQAAIISSNRLVEKLNAAVEFLGLHPMKDVYITFFKHYSPQWDQLNGRYGIIERPFRKMGEKAAKIMRKIYEGNISGQAIPPEKEKLKSICPAFDDIPTADSLQITNNIRR